MKLKLEAMSGLLKEELSAKDLHPDCLKSSWECLWVHWTSLVAQMVKSLSAMLETWVRSLGWEDTLEKEMATHSSTLPWKIPWTEESGRPQSMGSQRVRHDGVTLLLLFRKSWLTLVLDWVKLCSDLTLTLPRFFSGSLQKAWDIVQPPWKIWAKSWFYSWWSMNWHGTGFC